jgi:cell division protein FtsL
MILAAETQALLAQIYDHQEQIWRHQQQIRKLKEENQKLKAEARDDGLAERVAALEQAVAGRKK